MKDVIIHADVVMGLEVLENDSITVAITSPPYWRQRDYGFEGQIGREKNPNEYIGRLVHIFHVLRKKLQKNGIFFLNVGDKYLSRYGKSQLLQIPYRLARKMIDDGWHLKDIIMWHKTNHVPSSARDRFTITYEPVLVFSKNAHADLYKEHLGNVLKLPLQQTPWKHTAVFPESLVEHLLKRVNLMDDAIVLDPFAGTGTVATVVRKLRTSLFPKRWYAIMIEKGDHFVEIMKKRTKIKNIKKVIGDVHVPQEWKGTSEEKLPDDVKPKEITSDRHGEVYIADVSEEFLSILKGMTTDAFKTFHREDALYFFGVKNWTIDCLVHAHSLFQEGYVLRNMLIISNIKSWYPVFMFVKHSTRVAYKFYLDRVRTRPKTVENRDWWKENFMGVKVRDISRKKSIEGSIIKIVKRYEDGFPKIVVVSWKDFNESSVEMVLHPRNDELIMEGIFFRCPACKSVLKEPYDPVGENRCLSCRTALWTCIETIPFIEEPSEINEMIKLLENVDSLEQQFDHVNESGKKSKNTKSKFAAMDRLNWGASPGARKVMLGEYFTKMRLYRIDQPTIAQYLTLLRKHANLSIQNIIDQLPDSYKHTVGHWFRKDFGGSIPIPEDVLLLKNILKMQDGFFSLLERTALKFQTVKASIKGKNPGDFIEGMTDEELVQYLKKLYLPPREYLELIREN